MFVKGLANADGDNSIRRCTPRPLAPEVVLHAVDVESDKGNREFDTRIIFFVP